MSLRGFRAHTRGERRLQPTDLLRDVLLGGNGRTYHKTCLVHLGIMRAILLASLSDADVSDCRASGKPPTQNSRVGHHFFK